MRLYSLEKISFGKYPYLSARIRAMKSKLLVKHDYEKMVKMDLYTIAKFLEERGYPLPPDISGDKVIIANSIESAVNKDLESVLSKIFFITFGDARKIIMGYAVRFDVENLKTLLRGKLANEPLENVERLCICVGLIDRERLRRIYELDRCEEIIKETGLFGIDKEMREAIEVYERENRLNLLENVLDKKYYKFLVVLSRKAKHEGMLLRKFVMTRLDIVNLRTIYRLKRDGFGRDEIMNYVVPTGYRLKLKDLTYLASAETLDDLHQRAKETHYGSIIGDIDVSETFAELELALEKYFLKFADTLMHTSPISITPVIAYMIMKETEGRNIKMIVRGKEYGFDEDFIISNLVM